jgi:predicted PurR-regulated permease PerM
VLFAVFFWTFMWGIAGAFMGVPIAIAALTLREQHPSSRWIAGRPRQAGLTSIGIGLRHR